MDCGSPTKFVAPVKMYSIALKLCTKYAPRQDRPEPTWRFSRHFGAPPIGQKTKRETQKKILKDSRK